MKEALEKCKAHSPNAHVETIGELQSLTALLSSAKGDEVADLRTRIKGRIRVLVSEIWVLVRKVEGVNAAEVQVFLTTG